MDIMDTYFFCRCLIPPDHGDRDISVLDNKSGAFCKAPLLFIEKTTSYACGRKEP